VPSPTSWHREADIVVIGSGAAGIPAAIFAREAGASVILVEAEPDIGGHAITSGGNVPLGGGTSAQKAAGIEGSPDLVFLDNTDWSVVQPNGFPDYRCNDRELVRALADGNVATYEWLLTHGAVFADKAPASFGGTSIGNSVPREMHSVPMRWITAQTSEPEPTATAPTRSTGNGLIRPLEAAGPPGWRRHLAGTPNDRDSLRVTGEWPRLRNSSCIPGKRSGDQGA
jgi:choline dehydrogenase-like flavoprotein